MRQPQLHLITDSRLPLGRLLAAVDGGVDVVQVRDKTASPETLLALVRAVRVTVAGRVLVIVNGTVEMALAVGADGIHLAEGHPDLPRARQTLGPAAYIGVSVHSITAARFAAEAGATSVTFGHVYATPSHPGELPRGLNTLREVVAAVRLPVIAVGGIDARRVPEVLAAGAVGVAVISAILDAADPGEAARRLRAALGGGATGDLV